MQTYGGLPPTGPFNPYAAYGMHPYMHYMPPLGQYPHPPAPSLAPPVEHSQLGRKRTHEDLRSSSPIDNEDDMPLDGFIDLYMGKAAAAITDGLRHMQFLPGMEISNWSPEEWSKHGIEVGGRDQVARANKRYLRDKRKK
jgi:hypothetical protein